MSFISSILSGSFVLIAEIGVNYYDIARKFDIGLMDAAKLMCYKAKEVGISAVKFQSYKADSLASKESLAYWDTREEPATSQYELFKRYDSFSEAEYEELSEYCSSIGICFFSTAFDFNSVDYLDPLMPVYKISSSDLTNLPFIRYQANKQKPIIMSVGAGNREEIQQALSTIREVSSAPVILMHCVLEYPTPYGDANLRRITTLKESFPDTIIGYSDHCKPDKNYDVIKAAYLLGAHVIEKHFTLDKTIVGNDHYHSMDLDDAKAIIDSISFIECLLGNNALNHLQEESSARLNARRSIVAAQDIFKGCTITKEMLTFKRPGTGIAPSEVEHVIGSIARKNIEEDSLLQYDMLE